ncbi:MAG: hypothetical protein CBB72_011700 [Muricauda sp. TMED12]|nr:MAG: hypothetical protein CBB72_011700 [Muricauda sp. TMED12]
MRVIYYENKAIEYDGAKGKVYVDNKLVFHGFAYYAILNFISACNNNPKVREKFKDVLNMREKCKFEKKEAKKND